MLRQSQVLMRSRSNLRLRQEKFAEISFKKNKSLRNGTSFQVVDLWVYPTPLNLVKVYVWPLSVGLV